MPDYGLGKEECELKNTALKGPVSAWGELLDDLRIENEDVARRAASELMRLVPTGSFPIPLSLCKSEQAPAVLEGQQRPEPHSSLRCA